MLLSHAERLMGHVAPARAVAGPWWSRLASAFRTARTWWREAACGLGGHAMILRVEPGRLSLHCMECGHNTSGWRVGR